MKFTEVFKDKHQTYYVSDTPIKEVPNRSSVFEDRVKEVLYCLDNKINEEYELIDPIRGDMNKGFKYICISDARTHIERLVFYAHKFRNKKTGEIVFGAMDKLHIDGEMVMLTGGGNTASVHPHSYYLDRLIELNKDS